MDAGRLRYRVTIDERVTTQDEHGDEIVTWTPWISDEPAEIVPVSGKEFIAGQGIAAQVIARITIRWRAGVVPTMRVRHAVENGSPTLFDIYNIAAVLPDKETGRNHLALMVSRGVNEG